MMDRRQDAPCLEQTFVVLAFGNAVFHHAGADAERRRSVAEQQRADRDGQIDVSGEIDVAERAAVNAAGRAFQVADDFHRPQLGGAAERARRKYRSHNVERIHIVAHLARHVGNHVKDVGVLLNVERIVHAHGTDLGDPPDSFRPKSTNI